MISLQPAPRILLIACAAITVFGLGCSDKDGTTSEGSFVVKGKLVEDGNPFAFDPSKVPNPGGEGRPIPPEYQNSLLKVIFISADTKQEYEAETNADAGTFEVKGTNEEGIPAGRYRIAVIGSVGIGIESPETDYFKGRYSREKTQILRDIKPGDEVVIDVAKPKG